MGGGGKAPEPDPNIGIAALKTAKLGRKYLDVMKGQMEIANKWASEDRARSQSVYQPVENAYIREAQKYDSPWRQRQAGREAAADVEQQATLAREQSDRQMAAMGVNPKSGRYQGVNRGINFETALAKVGAENLAREQVRATGENMRLNVINAGKGYAVNPATSLGIAGSAASAGFTGAMQGQQAQGQMLSDQYRSQLAGWEAGQQSGSALFGALGVTAGMLPWGSILSDEEKKEDTKAPEKALPAIRGLGIRNYAYKPEVGDVPGKRHTGPMAQDWRKQTGTGDGKTIDVQDALGVTMKAVQELDAKVEQLGRGVRRRKAA